MYSTSMRGTTVVAKMDKVGITLPISLLKQTDINTFPHNYPNKHI